MAYLISYGVQFLTCVLEGVLFYYWSKCFIGIKRKGRVQIGIFIIVASAILYVTSFVPNRMLLFLLSILVLLVTGMNLFKHEHKAVLFYTLTYCTVGLAVYSIIELVFDLPITILIQGFLCIIVMKKLGSSNKMYAMYALDKNPIIIVVPALLSILEICLCGLEWIDRENVQLNGLFVGIGVVATVASIILIHFTGEFSKALREKEELMLRMEKDAIEKKHYQNMDAQHEQYDALIHDMKHVIRTMAVLSTGENSGEVEKLVERVDLSIGKISDKEYCSNKILNALLLERISFAEEKGVKLDLNIIEPLKLSQIEDLDLIAMMGNLLDNAIIAESKVASPKDVFCRVALSKDFEHIIIQTENSYEGKFFRAKAKPEGELGAKHGIGLNSIEKIVRKYGGIMESSVENGRYWTKIVIPT